MQLTKEQNTILANHIKTNPDPTVQAALEDPRNDDAICQWYNTLTATDAWNSAMTRQLLFEAMNIAQFDTLSAGKRDAWILFLDQASLQPHDFGRNQSRKAVVDVWSAAQATSILGACTRKATRCELIYGGSVEADASVSATDLVVEITLSPIDVSTALNANP